MTHPLITQAGHPVLRAQAAEVTREQFGTPDLRELADVMTAVMRAAPGVGLAAPQIGISLSVIVVEDTEERMLQLTPEERAERKREPVALRVLCNPALTPIGHERVTFFEGCLSVAGYSGMVERWHEVEVSAQDLDGHPVHWRVKGWPARILQHEADHLGGVLYVDRMVTRSFCCVAEAQGRWAHKRVKDVKAALGIVDGPPKGF